MGKRRQPAWSSGWKRFKSAARNLMDKALPEGTWSDRRKFLMGLGSAVGVLWLGHAVWDQHQPLTVPNSGSIAVTPLTATLSATGQVSIMPSDTWYTAVQLAATRPRIAPMTARST
jgi:hypothetical protein